MYINPISSENGMWNKHLATFYIEPEFVSIIIAQFMMSANSRIRFALQIVLICLYSTPSHYHHCANLSEFIEIIKYLSDTFCRVYELD